MEKDIKYCEYCNKEITEFYCLNMCKKCHDDDFISNLKKASETVKTWAEWKQNIWGVSPANQAIFFKAFTRIKENNAKCLKQKFRKQRRK